MRNKFLAIFNEKNNDKKILKLSNDQTVFDVKLNAKHEIFKSFKIYDAAAEWLSNLYYVDYRNIIPAIYCDSSFRVHRTMIEIQYIVYYDHRMLSSIFTLPSSEFTNNQGELLGLFFSLWYVLFIDEDIKYVFSDSKIVIYFWSFGFINSNNNFTIKLCKIVSMMRQFFVVEKQGKISYIDSSVNPADLGYHK